jgi:hypothetical protein
VHCAFTISITHLKNVQQAMEGNVPSTGGNRPPLTPEEKAARNLRRKQQRAAKRASGPSADLTAMVLQHGQPRPQRGVSVVTLPRGQQLLVGRGAYDYRKGGREVGADLGGMAGEAMGGVVSRLLGRGAYTLRKNSVMRSSTQMPRMSAAPDGGFVVTSREFIMDIAASGQTAWSITSSINLNPGLAQVFSFLSQLGVAFEEYEFDQFVVVYEPSSGSVSTTQALGTVQLATQYDLQDAAFGSQTEMLDYEYSTTNRPDFAMLHPIECDPRQNQIARFYVRSGLLAGTTTTVDPRYNAYDIGRLIVAQAGVPAAAGTVLGKLFFSYTCRFLKPKLYGGLASYNLLHDAFTFTTTYVSNTLTAVSTPTNSANATLGCSLTGVLGTGFILAFPPAMQTGNFYVIITAGATGLTQMTQVLNFGNLTNLAQTDDNTTISSASSLVSFGASIQRFTITGANASCACGATALTNGVVGTGSVAFVVRVVQCFGGPI